MVELMRGSVAIKKAPRKGKRRGGRPHKKTEVFDFDTLRWSTAPSARRSIVLLMSTFTRGGISEGTLRVLVYAGRALLPFMEYERDSRIEDRLSEIEKKLLEIMGGKTE